MTVDSLPASADDAPATPRAPEAGAPQRSPFTLLLTVAPYIVLLGTFGFLVKRAAKTITNNDTYFHLRFGEEFLHGGWSLQNPGSVTTFGTNDWVPTQWLPQVVMAQMEDWFGLAGVAWLAGSLFILLAVTLWFVARRYAGPIPAVAVVVVALLAASPGLSMRPQVVSYVFVALTTAAWFRTSHDGKVRWWLVPLTWVWATAHGMWPIGLVIGAVALVGIALDRVVPRRIWLRHLLVLVLSAAATALTPVGPKLWSAVLLVNSRGTYFSEWQPAHFTKPYAVAFLVLACVLLLRMMRRTTPASWTEALLVLLAGGWALYTARTVMVAAVMLVPFAAKAVQELARRRVAVGRREVGVVLAGAALSLVTLALVVPQTADEPPPDADWYAELDALPAGTVVLNDWTKGGYLMWRFPGLDLVSNGYGDIFTDQELERNFRMDATQPGWLRYVRQTGAEYALLAPGSYLEAELMDIADWRLVHRGDFVDLLVPPDDWPDGAPG